MELCIILWSLVSGSASEPKRPLSLERSLRGCARGRALSAGRTGCPEKAPGQAWGEAVGPDCRADTHAFHRKGVFGADASHSSSCGPAKEGTRSSDVFGPDRLDLSLSVKSPHTSPAPCSSPAPQTIVLIPAIQMAFGDAFMSSRRGRGQGAQ